MNTPRILTASATGLVALFALAACGSTQTSQPVHTETVIVTAAPATSTSTSVTTSSSASASQSASSVALGYTNDDVLSAVEAVQSQYPNAVIIQVDADDRGATFDVDIVDGETQLDLRVDSSGTITTEETDQTIDADDNAEAQEAKITALQAINGALENKDGVLVDSAELERENGTLVWKVELDNEQGQVQATILVNATDGSMTQQ